MKYFRFIIKGSKTRLSVSMTNKEVDAYMYLNHESMNKEVTEFQWKSEGSYNEYIDISIEDPYFVSRRMNNLDGEYYLAIRGFRDTYYNLYISDLNTKIMTITDEFPGTCTCEKDGDYCYFRYENINSPDIAEVNEQELIFYFEFTYGSADIYASLFENGNNGVILNNLPSQYKKDYKSLYSNQYLTIKLTPRTPKYTLDSVLVLGTRCKSKSLFDFNVRPLWKSGDILRNHEGFAYLSMDRDNVFYISENSDKPINLTLYSITNLPITFEARAISGSAKVHSYVFNDEESLNDEMNINKIKGYKHLSEFSVDEKDSKSHFDSISQENSFRQNLFFEVKAKRDCLFSIYLHFNQYILSVPMSKETVGKFTDGKFYAYIELLPEYEQVIFNVDKMHSQSQFSIYVKTKALSSLYFKSMFTYYAPSTNNYDIKATTNKFSPTLSIKIKNLPKELYEKGKKVISMIYIEPENEITFKDKLNIIAYPNVNHFERITPSPKKYIFSSLRSNKVDTSVFSFKQQEEKDNLLIIEISSCKGNLGYKLTDSLSSNLGSKNSPHNFVMEEKGKKIIVVKIEKNVEYYLSVFSLKEDEMIFNDYNIKSEDIDFLLYYYTTDMFEYASNQFDSKITYDIKGPGNLVLYLPNFEKTNNNIKNKLEDISVSLIITQNENEFDYMGSICFLTKKIEYIEEKKSLANYNININKNKNEIEISNLDKNQNYYMNVLITNQKTGQVFALDPLQVKPFKIVIVFGNNFPIILLLIGIIFLLAIIFYFYRKYRITKAIVNYESNDIKKLGSIPKSITELKQIHEEKSKKAKEKYNTLTEDSGQV